MISKEIGFLKEIVRHPVKSFRGQSVASTRVESYGLYGDRSHTFLDDSRPGKYLTSTQIPAMLGYQAEFLGEENSDSYPPVQITTPQGKIYRWEDAQLLEEIRALANRSVSQKKYSTDLVPIGAIDEEHLTIATESSLRQMEKWWGKSIHPRRFRANLLLSLDNDQPFAEDDWIGKHLIIGEVVILIKGHTERCPIINIHPDSLETDPSLMQTAISERNNMFCVYGTVLQTGIIHCNDRIQLIEPEQQ